MTTVKKRCTKCGVVGDYSPGQRRCRHRRFGPRSYCCWGHLERVVPEKKEKPMPKHAERPQDRAAAEARRCEQMVDRCQRMTERCIARLANLSKSQRRWQQRANMAHRRAEMTDAQVAERKAAASARAKERLDANVRRGIKLEGGQS